MGGNFIEFKPSGKLVVHGGSGTGYSNYGCRCEECTIANNKRVRRRIEERTGMLVKGGKHGKAATYSNWGCRCAECCAAHAKRCSAYYISRKG